MDYSPEVRQRFRSPHGAGEFPRDTEGLLWGEARDRTLNVQVRFQVQVTGGMVRSSRYRVFGCPHTVAAASWVAEWLEGRPARALRQFDAHRLAARLELPVEKLGKLLLIEDALIRCADALEKRTRNN